MEQYKITKRIMIGVEQIGFTILDNKNKERQLKEEDIIEMCKRNLISNASIILDSETCRYEVIVHDDIELMIKKNKSIETTVVTRIIDDNNNCVGYIAKDKNGNTHKLNKNTLWKLAYNGSVKNIKAEINNKNKLIFSTGDVKLSNLPVLNKEQLQID